jgi:DNA-binding GntR family transcriptional regulator
MISLEALEREDSLRDKALRILRQAIVSGDIRAGELYSAAALARRLGVSVSPVREAMLTLVNAGIMEPVRNRGFRVAELTRTDLAEIFELRVLLEVPSVKSLADRDLSGERERLDALVRDTETSAQAHDVNTFLASDREYHLALIELHGNSRLTSWVANLRDQTRLYGLMESDTHTLKAAAAEHRAILDAIFARDADEVGRVLTRHLGHIQNEWAAQPARLRRGTEARLKEL